MIYFLEDDNNIRKLVSYALTRDGFEIKDFALPSDFNLEMKKALPQLILLDIMLPQEDGLSILTRLKENEETQDIPVIMLTAKDSEFDTVTGLDMGADDYIAKPFGMTELLSRVRAVLRRYEKTRSKESKVYTIGKLYVNPEKHIISVDGKSVSLSYKEFLLLLLLLKAEGKVVKRDELLTKIWGEFYEDSRTLDVHIRKLRIKLKDAGNIIETIKGIGYKIGGNFDE